jgi:alkyl sulfatase BDS1-like metallo-beta-lactamase superfamily hydrolase
VWAARLPAIQAAHALQADALDQAESGPWRNFYLSVAKELREGVKLSHNQWLQARFSKIR